MTIRLPELRLADRLGIGAGLIGIIALLACIIMIYGARLLTERVDASLAAESRIRQYSALSSQITSLAVVAFEARGNSDQAIARADRFTAIFAAIDQSFRSIREAQDANVNAAERFGLNEQSRRATLSINLARMEAVYEQMSSAPAFVATPPDDGAIRAQLDVFSTTFLPLLNIAVSEEQRFRDAAFADIQRIRMRLTQFALGGAALTVLMLAAFYFGLIRPQLARLDRLRDAAQMIGREQFGVALPETRRDEIGTVFSEVNRMAEKLGARQQEVDADRAELNNTIARQTLDLRAANTALAETDENRRRFFADISHEMRTPLTVILMESELADQGTVDPMTALQTIRARALSLNRRVDDLLRISRSDSGTLSVVAEPFDLVSAAQEAVAETTRIMTRAGLEVSLDAATPVSVIADPNWVRQTISGLLENAARHASDGTKVHLSVTETATEGRVTVTDDGPGIPLDEQERVFQRFEQGQGPKSAHGFGIGLALAQWVIEEQGGALTLTSPAQPDTALLQGAGPGTMVAISLPKNSG